MAWRLRTCKKTTGRVPFRRGVCTFDHVLLHASKLVLGLVLVALSGCAAGLSGGAPPPVAVIYQNPSLVPNPSHEVVWDQVADVVSGYFRIEKEQPVRIVGNVFTEGRIDTYPQGGATLLEPQRRDSVGAYNRWESTLQTIRRKAHLRVQPAPAEGGFLVEVVVEKELESLPKPERTAAGATSFLSDRAPRGVGSIRPTKAEPSEWIPLGRDIALEQAILAKIHARLDPPAR
jgi:hypothetical protein